MAKTLASNRRRYLQLVRALIKRDLVTLIEVDEVREHAGVFLEENQGKYTATDCCREGQQHAFSTPAQGQLGDFGGPESCRGSNGDNVEDPDDLPYLEGLHLALGDVKDAFNRFKISKLYSSFFALPEVLGKEVGASSVGRVCPCFSSLPMGHTLSLFFCQNAIEEAMWATPGLGEAEMLQDTRSCVLSRPSGGDDIKKSSHQTTRRFFFYMWITLVS